MPKDETDKDELVQKTQDFIANAIKRLKKCVDADEHNRRSAVEDLKFLNGDQWEPNEKQRRKLRQRPCLQINLLPKFVDQVVGDERHNRPKVKIRPIDSKADVHIAKIREGIISNIEYISNAPAIYDEAFESMVSCGYGAWRILTRYTEENPFLQEIYMEPIENPFLVYLDPDAKDATLCDAKYGFILTRMPEDEFKEKYPGKECPTKQFTTATGIGQELWYVDNLVTVAEYFVRKMKSVKMCQMSDGDVLTEEEANQRIQEWEDLNRLRMSAPGYSQMFPAGSPVGTPPPPPASPMLPSPGGLPGPAIPGAAPPNPMAAPGAAPTPGVPPPAPPVPGTADIQQPPGTPPGTPPIPTVPLVTPPTVPASAEEAPRIVNTRMADVPEIRHYVISAVEIIEGGLSGHVFPGKYIPIILLRGKKRNIEGKRYIRGLIRDAKDPQRMVNYWNTAAAETIALAPKAPWLGTAKMFEGYENDYAAANQDNFPFLKYNIDPLSPQSYPQRTHVGEPPVAIFQQIARGEDNIKSVIGMFNADVGAASPETTGAAIIQRQRPGDIGTFAFLDNLSRSVMHSAKIINEMIPEIYDTERDVRVRHLDETETYVPVNTTVGNAMNMIGANENRFRGMDLARLKQQAKKHGRTAKFNDLTVGKYDVAVTVGPSYATARAEAVDTLVKLLQTNPRMAQMMMDLVVENMDFKDADKLAARLRKMLPPGLVAPRDDEAPAPPMPPAPQVQIAQGKIKVELAKIDVQKARLEVEKIKALKEAADAKGEVRKLIMQILQEVHGVSHPADTIGMPQAAGAGRGAPPAMAPAIEEGGANA